MINCMSILGTNLRSYQKVTPLHQKNPLKPSSVKVIVTKGSATAAEVTMWSTFTLRLLPFVS